METRQRLQCSMAQDQSSPLTHALERHEVRTPEETSSNTHLTSRGKVLRSKTGRSSVRVEDHFSSRRPSGYCPTDPTLSQHRGQVLLPPQHGTWNLRYLLSQKTSHPVSPKIPPHADNSQPTSPSFTQTVPIGSSSMSRAASQRETSNCSAAQLLYHSFSCSARGISLLSVIQVLLHPHPLHQKFLLPPPVEVSSLSITTPWSEQHRSLRNAFWVGLLALALPPQSIPPLPFLLSTED